jgi:hypothetical protein
MILSEGCPYQFVSKDTETSRKSHRSIEFIEFEYCSMGTVNARSHHFSELNKSIAPAPVDPQQVCTAEQTENCKIVPSVSEEGGQPGYAAANQKAIELKKSSAKANINL